MGFHMHSFENFDFHCVSAVNYCVLGWHQERQVMILKLIYGVGINMYNYTIDMDLMRLYGLIDRYISLESNFALNLNLSVLSY